jgi:hypothetical protein
MRIKKRLTHGSGVHIVDKIKGLSSKTAKQESRSICHPEQGSHTLHICGPCKGSLFSKRTPAAADLSTRTKNPKCFALVYF